jgi:thiamine-phosphate pyrophosphorylase
MKMPAEVPESLAHTVLVSGCALVSGCPNFPEGEESLGRLGEALIDLTEEVEVVTPALTLGGALSLARTAAVSLDTISTLCKDDEMPAELAEVLSRVLGELSAQLGAALRREKADKIRGLYVIIDPEVTGGRAPLEIAQAAVSGGAKMLQLRDKLRDKGEILPLAQELQSLCEANDVLLIVNDHVDLAAAVGSGGVHVGQTDLPVSQARQVLAPEQVLGRSNREIDLLIESQEMGADHVAFGAIYQTTTKPGGRGPQGPERLKGARAVTKVPLVAIGGITAENVAPVIEYGADAVCVTAAVGLALQPEAAAARLVGAIAQAGGKV